MKLLALRLSALGDVAMTIPIVTSLAQQYPQLEITFLSKPFVESLFAEMPSNVKFLGVNVQNYHGVWGLFRLFIELKKRKYDAVADLHDVLRTKILRKLFRLTGTQTAYIKKGRKEKQALVRKKHKIMQQLPSSFTRYEEVFKQLGYPVTSKFHSIYGNKKGETNLFVETTGLPDGKKWIGFAPFAAHKGKELPTEIVKRLLQELSAFKNWRIFLFGGGDRECQLMKSWSEVYSNIEIIAGKLSLNNELSLMSHLDAMISMDSGNMHLASLVGIPVISIWGATHPFSGFMGWQQSTDNVIQTELVCRPCSVFGNKPCYRGDYACLTKINTQVIIKKLENIIVNNYDS